MKQRGGKRQGAGRPKGATTLNSLHRIYMWWMIELTRDKRRGGRYSVLEGSNRLKQELDLVDSVRTIREWHKDSYDRIGNEAKAQSILKMLREWREASDWKLKPIDLVFELHRAKRQGDILRGG